MSHDERVSPSVCSLSQIGPAVVREITQYLCRAAISFYVSTASTETGAKPCDVLRLGEPFERPVENELTFAWFAQASQ